MKQIALVFALGLALILPQNAQADDPIEGAIQGVISQQIDAFLANDLETAFGFASPGVKGQFRNRDIFGHMVEMGYPMVWSPSGTEFLDLRELNGQVWQQVLLRDSNGVYHMVDYKMIETGDGWRIDGVQLIKQAGIGA